MFKIRPVQGWEARCTRLNIDVGVQMSDELMERCLILARLNGEPEVMRAIAIIEQNGFPFMDVVDCFEKRLAPESVAWENEMIDVGGVVNDGYEVKEVIEFISAVSTVYEQFAQICTRQIAPHRNDTRYVN